jgi:large subunit ribosomal protein L9
MKVILLKDVPKVGRKYEEKSVADGYALNFLIPKGLAETATPVAVKRIMRFKAVSAEEKKIQEELIGLNLKALEGATLELKEKANEKGHLFAAVHKEEIAARLQSEKHIDILPEFIEIEEPIKAVGEYEMTVKVKDKSAKLKLVVTGVKS